MKKIVILILVLILLYGCGNSSSNIQSELEQVFSNNNFVMTKSNNYTDYIDFYLPSDIKEEYCNDTSYVYNVDDCKLIISINLPTIFNEYYYGNAALRDDGLFSDDNLIYSFEGETLNQKVKKTRYYFKAYQYDDMYILHLVTSDLELCGYCYKDRVKMLASKMLQMVNNSNVNKDNIIRDYSSRDIIDYERNKVNLFETIYPRDGYVKDILKDQVSY